MQQIGAHLGGFTAMHDHARPYLLAEVEQFVGDEAVMFAFIPVLSSATGFFAIAKRAAVLGIGVGHVPGVDPILKQVTDHLLVDGHPSRP